MMHMTSITREALYIETTVLYLSIYEISKSITEDFSAQSDTFLYKKEIGVSVNEFRFAFHMIWVMG